MTDRALMPSPPHQGLPTLSIAKDFLFDSKGVGTDRHGTEHDCSPAHKAWDRNHHGNPKCLFQVPSFQWWISGQHPCAIGGQTQDRLAFDFPPFDDVRFNLASKRVDLRREKRVTFGAFRKDLFQIALNRSRPTRPPEQRCAAAKRTQVSTTNNQPVMAGVKTFTPAAPWS